MRIRAALTLLSLIPATAFSIAASGSETCSVLDEGDPAVATDDVLACEATEYLAGCDGFEGGKVYHPLVHTTSIPTSPDAPTTSYTAGGGCGTVDDPMLNGTRQDTAFSLDVRGYPTVNADTMTVELHDISASRMRQSGTTVLGVRVSDQRRVPARLRDQHERRRHPVGVPAHARRPRRGRRLRDRRQRRTRLHHHQPRRRPLGLQLRGRRGRRDRGHRHDRLRPRRCPHHRVGCHRDPEPDLVQHRAARDHHRRRDRQGRRRLRRTTGDHGGTTGTATAPSPWRVGPSVWGSTLVSPRPRPPRSTPCPSP